MGVIEAFGKLQIYAFVFGIFIVSMVFLGVGIWIVRRPEDTTHTAKVQGKYSDVNCVLPTQCTSTVTYQPPCSSNNTCNTYTLSDTFGAIKNGDSVEVRYDPKNPSDGTAKPPLTKTIGWVFIAVSIVFFLISFFAGRAYSQSSNNNRQKYSRVAAAMGAMSYFS